MKSPGDPARRPACSLRSQHAITLKGGLEPGSRHPRMMGVREGGGRKSLGRRHRKPNCQPNFYEREFLGVGGLKLPRPLVPAHPWKIHAMKAPRRPPSRGRCGCRPAKPCRSQWHRSGCSCATIRTAAPSLWPGENREPLPGWRGILEQGSAAQGARKMGFRRLSQQERVLFHEFMNGKWYELFDPFLLTI